jgi:hypothetical protein
MIVMHSVADEADNEISLEEISVAAHNEGEFHRWLDEVRSDYAVKGYDAHHNRHYGRNPGAALRTHYWWSASPFD